MRESYCLNLRFKLGLRDTGVAQRVYIQKGAESKSESVSYQVTNPNGTCPKREKMCL